MCNIHKKLNTVGPSRRVTGPLPRRAPRTARLSYNGGMLNIRAASIDDIPLILEFIRDLAEYEKASQEAVATAAQLRRHGFSERPRFQVLIAEWDGQPAGFALYFYHFSTWVGRPTLFLEDLFVRPQFRRQGIGKALLLYLAKVAEEEDCGRFEWQVLDWNTPAIEFYQSLGARALKEWLTMRVSGQALEELAAQGRAQGW